MDFTFDDILLLPTVSEVSPENANTHYNDHGLNLKMPIMSAAMDTVSGVQMVNKLAELGALGVLHSNVPLEVWKVQLEELVTDKWVGISLPPNEKGLAMFDVLKEMSLRTVLVVDSAHGGAKSVIEFTRHVSKFHDGPVIAGNVVTLDCAESLEQAGANLVKVGIGPSGICTTRTVSGVGRPQASAISELSTYSIVADGGIRSSGDIVKALSLGADLVMVGSLLAGTDEAPGEIVEVNGKLYKQYRGMGSLDAMAQGSDARYRQGKMQNRIAEGVAGLVPYKGPVESVINQLVAGLKVGMGYLNAPTLKHLSQAKYVKISDSSKKESGTYGITQL